MGIGLKSARFRKYAATAGINVFPYHPTKHEQRAHNYCIDNDIRISPIAAQDGIYVSEWYVGVSTPEDYKKVYKSRFKYNNEQIWPEVYNAKVYYYDKHLRESRSGGV